MIDAAYYRLNPIIEDDVYLDEKDNTKLINLMWEVQVYIYENRSLFEKVAHALLCS